MEAEFQREYRRAKGIAPLLCENVLGRLHDISRGGLAFGVKAEEAAKFVIGQSYDMTIKLPQISAEDEKMEVTLLGEIRSTQLDAWKKRLVLGVMFNEMTAELRQQLNQVILFFAKHFAEIQDLDEDLSLALPKKEPILSHAEMSRVYQWALTEFESLPETTQIKIHDYAFSLNQRFNVLASR